MGFQKGAGSENVHEDPGEPSLVKLIFDCLFGRVMLSSAGWDTPFSAAWFPGRMGAGFGNDDGLVSSARSSRGLGGEEN
jgi:hypothetical protein